jgi:hypothetical protein
MRQATLGMVLFVATGAGGSIVAHAQDMSSGTCTAGGHIYQPGDIACIPACHGQQRLAKCDQSAKGFTWTTISDSCPSAMNLLSPRQDLASAAFMPVCQGRS